MEKIKKKIKSTLKWGGLAAAVVVGVKMHSRIKYLEGSLKEKEKECARKDWLIIKMAKKSGYDFANSTKS